MGSSSAYKEVQWEEARRGDPREDDWRAWPDAWSESCEKQFRVYHGTSGRQGRRGDVNKDCGVDFLLMTARKKVAGRDKPVIVPIRRLDRNSGKQTHPDPEKNHPWFDKRVSMADEKGGWLTSEFFWKAFCKCCEMAGREVHSTAEGLFDFQHNRDYRDWTDTSEEVRGGLRYAIPRGWKRFSCRVKGKYGQENSWLRLDGGAGEWAVAYHGTSYAALVPILDGGLIVGGAQAFKNKKDVRTGEVIGEGVYCSPSLAVGENYAGAGTQARGTKGGTLIDGHNVYFVLQCRVNPDKIKRCHDEATDDFTSSNKPYWVLNDPADIRPYAILVKEA